MAKARALDKRRKSVRNIRKITRTMELIASAKFKKAMDRAHSATEFTRRTTQLVTDLARSGLKVSHPLLEQRENTERILLLVLTANRGLCGGYNASVLRAALVRLDECKQTAPGVHLEVSGKRGISALKFRKIPIDESYTHFEDQPKYEEVEQIANRILDAYSTGQIDRVDIVYTQFVNAARQDAVVETLLPITSLTDTEAKPTAGEPAAGQSDYEFLPSAESILAEVVPLSFRVKLFKCFLDSAVSEQISRMVAMKAATENAGDMIRRLSLTYNRARQTQITNEIMEIIGGVEALNK